MMQLSIVSVPVSNQDVAKAFYRDVVGFKVHREEEMGLATRWLHMVPPSGYAGIALVTWFESMPAGSAQGLMLETIDIELAHERLVQRGLEITDIQEAKWGRFATFFDPDGNGWVLTQVHRLEPR